MRKSIEATIEEIVQPIVDAKNFEIVDIEYVKEAGEYYLRVYLDKEGGISLSDCEVVSRELSEILDHLIKTRISKDTKVEMLK